MLSSELIAYRGICNKLMDGLESHHLVLMVDMVIKHAMNAYAIG